jgi:hypothetical protein
MYEAVHMGMTMHYLMNTSLYAQTFKIMDENK